MSTWKLPRKRKKAFIALHGRGAYRLQVQANSLLPGKGQGELFELELWCASVAEASAQLARGLQRSVDSLTMIGLLVPRMFDPQN